ncbi:hypothetical protein E2P64_07395 [Candidatus Bathyarchaeota archaeon]|nr:hypothetical protein E2P64_07395 [Candidatus Bathyarchaeota archaeon]
MSRQRKDIREGVSPSVADGNYDGIFHPGQDLLVEDFRKKATSSKKKSPSMPNLTLLPTNVQIFQGSTINDYLVKACIMFLEEPNICKEPCPISSFAFLVWPTHT